MVRDGALRHRGRREIEGEGHITEAQYERLGRGGGTLALLYVSGEPDQFSGEGFWEDTASAFSGVAYALLPIGLGLVLLGVFLFIKFPPWAG